MSLNLNEDPHSNFDNFEIEVSKGTRFVHYIIDTICSLILVMVVAIMLGVALGVVLAILFGPEFNTESIVIELFFNVIGLILWVSYYILFEYFFQRTPGKFLTGSIVISDNGGRPSFGQVVGRSFARLIPFEPLIGLFSDFLHDTLPGTKVVMKK